MTLYECSNFENCKTYVSKPGQQCERCREEAVMLSRRVDYDAKLERLNYIPKSDGQHRRRGRGRR